MFGSEFPRIVTNMQHSSTTTVLQQNNLFLCSLFSMKYVKFPKHIITLISSLEYVGFYATVQFMKSML